MGNVEAAAKVVALERVMHGITSYPGDLKGPAHVASKGDGYVRIHSADGRHATAHETVAEILNSAGFDCVLDPDLERAIWEKVAFNAALNSLTAVTGLTVGAVGASASGQLLAKQIVAETGSVARAGNIAFDEDAVWHAISRAFAEHADHKPSTLQDIIHGRATEIGSINGAIAAVALEHGIRVPVTETLYHLVRIKEQQR